MSAGEDDSSRKPRDRSKSRSETPNSNTLRVTKCSRLTVVLRKCENSSLNRIHQLFGPQKEMTVTEGQHSDETKQQDLCHVSCCEKESSARLERSTLDSSASTRKDADGTSLDSVIKPSGRLSLDPVTRPLDAPSLDPVISPSDEPSLDPVIRPSGGPSLDPVIRPSGRPSLGPVIRPSGGPSLCSVIRPSDMYERHCDAAKSGYDFKSVKEKFENWSTLSSNYVTSCQRGRPVLKTSKTDASKRSHSASSTRSLPSFVHSAPPSPEVRLNRSTDLYVSQPDLSGIQAVNYPSVLRRASGSFSASSVFKHSPSSDLSIASRSVQPSNHMGNSYHRYLVPEGSVNVKAAVAHFSKPPAVPRFETLRKSLCVSPQLVTKSSQKAKFKGQSPHLPSGDSAAKTLFKQPSAFQHTVSQQSQHQTEQTHSLDNWLQSVLQTKEMGKEGQDVSKQKQNLSSFDTDVDLGDHGVGLWSRGKGLEPEVKVSSVHGHIPKGSTTKCSENIESAQGFAHGCDTATHGSDSGKYQDTLVSGASCDSLSRNPNGISYFQSVGSSREPPVTICITQDPDDVETQYLSLSDTHLDEDLNAQHLPLSPRSSFGSVCSFKSSNADSAVDMNNPDEETSESVIENKASPSQPCRRPSKHSRTSESGSLSHENSPSPSTYAAEVPKVLVSDHSGTNLSELPITVQADIQQAQLNDKDLERIPRPWSPEDSAYSGNSDLSLDDSDEEDPPPPPKKKQSSWKIIRSIVRWSPFVQVFKKNKYPWIQLAGHQGNFQAGESGAVLKKLDSREKQCYRRLMNDTLKPFVPEYRGDTEKCGENYIQLQDLLCEFNTPCVMDIKMGCRTYLEEELEKARSKPTLRKDMYKKMIEVDANAPSAEEREKEGVTKARYLQWRDEMSSSVSLGFRIEGIKKSDGSSSKDFKKTKTKEHVFEKLKSFIGENTTAVSQYIDRLKAITAAQEESEFFQRHEVISSSLLFVHDSEKASVWMIDFGKTEPLPSTIQIDHRSQWIEGNHEDGYLAGVDRLISIFTDLLNES